MMRGLLLSTLLVACGLSTLVVACGGSTNESTPTNPDSATSDTATGDTAVVTETAPPLDAAEAATLEGKVLRKPLTKPQNGGKGNVYVALFDHDPVTDRTNAKVVGQVIVPDADMTADTASVAYSIGGIPPRAAPYFVIAFLDDNHNAAPTNPGPDKGDLVSLDGIAAPKVTVAKPGKTTLDIPLNAAMPF